MGYYIEFLIECLILYRYLTCSEHKHTEWQNIAISSTELSPSHLGAVSTVIVCFSLCVISNNE